MNSVIIVAGGVGNRMGSIIPKQFLMLNGLPIILHTVKHFLAFDPKIYVTVVLPKEHVSTWETVCKKYDFHVEHKMVEGGDTRYQSVKNGLKTVNKAEFTAVHDSVRPLIHIEFIKNCFEAAYLFGNAVPCIEVSETIREISEEGSKPLNRSAIRLIQTPQVFKTSLLKQAYEIPFSEMFTDDASVVEALGEKIHLVGGLKQNIKITTSDDLQWAEWKSKELQNR